MKVKVGVFFGGKSTEHEISCITANQAIHAIDENKYEVLPIYISKQGDFYIGEALFDLANYSTIVKDPDKILTKVCLYKDGAKALVVPVKSIFAKAREIDIAFVAVHGTNVEDGSLAGYLSMLDIPYTSCDPLGGAVGQDKAVMKDIFKAENIPMVDYFVVYGSDFELKYDEYFAQAKKIKFPLIAKPANLGSSVGVEVINSADEFKSKINECLKYDFKVVVEKLVKNLKEVNISVMGNIDNARFSVIEEVTNGFLDYNKKYQPGGAKGGSKKLGSKSGKLAASKGMASTVRKIPADITATQKKTIEETALKVFRILNSHGVVRIDYMIDTKTKKVYCNEINTIPGSLSFYLWEKCGMNFTEQCEEMIKNALTRYAKRSKKTYSFDTNILDSYKK